MTLKEKITILLIEYPSLREKKSHLQSAVWQTECRDLDIPDLEGFFIAYEEGFLSNAESIRRGACKIMAENPKLKPSEETQKKNEELNQHIRNNKGEL